MNIEHLIEMANQIGQSFESVPDQNQAVNDIASHLKRFWEPRMRKAILAHVANGGEGLRSIVMKAVQENQELLA